MRDATRKRATGRPYFGPEIVGLQSPPIRHAYMRAVVDHLAKTPGRTSLRILEIGSWAGASAITWAKALQSLFGGRGTVLCVDIWKPYIDTSANAEEKFEIMSRAAEDGSIFNLFLDNVRAAAVDDIIEYRVGSSRDVLPQMPAGSFDIVYVDGSHTYEDVAFDLEEAQRLVSANGIVCGDDLEVQFDDVDQESNAAAARSGRDTMIDPRSGVHYHPGVTLAVREAFGKVSEWEGFWAVQRQDSGWSLPDLAQYPLEIPEHLSDLPRLVESYGGFNLFERAGRCCAVRQTLGPVNVAAPENELTGSFAAHDVFFSDSVECAKLRIDLMETRDLLQQSEHHLTLLEQGPGDPLEPQLVGEYRGFNIVRLGRRYCAVRQSLGAVDLRASDEELAQRFHRMDLAVSVSPHDAKGHIDTIELELLAREHQERLLMLERRASAMEEDMKRTNQNWVFRVLRKLHLL